MRALVFELSLIANLRQISHPYYWLFLFTLSLSPSIQPTPVSLDTINNLRNFPSLRVVAFDALGRRAAVPFANVGVSRAHGLVPRSFLWCAGPSPCTTEDHPWLFTSPMLLIRVACCHHQSRRRAIILCARPRSATTFIWAVRPRLSGQRIFGVWHFHLPSMTFRLLAILPLYLAATARACHAISIVGHLTALVATASAAMRI